MTDITVPADGADETKPARKRVVIRHTLKSAEAVEREKHEADARAKLKRRAADRVADDGSVEPVDYTDEQYEAAFADARRSIDEQLATTRKRQGAMRYLSVFGLVAALGLGGLYHFNGRFAQELYDRDYSEKIAEAFDNGENFGVFDLNIDIRNLRDAHIAKLDRTPDVVLLGASHWQEADVALVTDREMYNAHIHRDYYEDPLAMIEMFERHNKLPDTMILTLRDNQFTPVAARTDFLWLPGIPYYRKMAKYLGIEAHHPVETAPVDTWRNRLSLDILHGNIKRWLEADVKPGPTTAEKSETLDILLPGGSIVWSNEHDRFFSQERSRKEALDFAAHKAVNPPMIDPKGVEHIDTLLTYLDEKGVRVYLAHPPFNPIYWEAVQGTPYMEGLRKVEDLTKSWADKFGWEIVGGFDPGPLGCRADQYIDAEHANRTCLSAIFEDFMAKDRAYHGLPPLDAEEDEGSIEDKIATAIPDFEPGLGTPMIDDVETAATQREREPVKNVQAAAEPTLESDPNAVPGARTRNESISKIATGAGLKTNEALSLLMSSQLRGDIE